MPDKGRRLTEFGALLVFSLLLLKGTAESLVVIYGQMGDFTSDVVWAVSVYLLSHLVRMLRLAVLIGGIRIRWLASLYFFTSACSMVTPFKLGELFRIHEIGRCTGNLWKGLWLVWIERTFDMCVIGLALLLLLATRSNLVDAVLPLIIVILAFIVLTFATFMILPEHLDNLNLYVLKTYRGVKAIRILTVLEYFGNLCHMARDLVHGKLSTLVVLTLLVWGLELTAIAIATGTAEPLIESIFLLLQGFVGLLTTDGGRHQDYAAHLDHYAAAQYGLLTVLGAVSLLYYGRERVRRILSLDDTNG